MDAFAAIVLVCLASTPVEACDEASAVEVSSIRVPDERGCLRGWQEVIARATGRDGEGTYVRTLCRRLRGVIPDDPPPR